MDIKFGPRGITEPVRRHPIKGMLEGLAMGTILGLLARGSSPPSATPAQIVVVYALAGTVAGGLVGALLPLFRNRLAAGLVVTLAGALAYLILDRLLWKESMPIWAGVFLGFCLGFAYAVLFWKFKPPGGQSDQS